MQLLLGPINMPGPQVELIHFHQRFLLWLSLMLPTPPANMMGYGIHIFSHQPFAQTP